MAGQQSAGDAFAELVDVVETLRDPGGCPWDAEQTHRSLRQHILEEVYETLEAIDNDDPSSIEEELGDLLTHVTFHADIGRRAGNFDAASICERVTEKLRRRHPHVFGDGEKLGSSDDVVEQWEALKRRERGRTSIVGSLPSAMPALAYSVSVQKRAKRAGLDGGFQVKEPLFKRLERESEEEAEQRAGEFLMRIAMEVANAGVDPETALRNAAVGFRDRVLRAESMVDGRALSELDEDERARVWEEAGHGD